MRTSWQASPGACEYVQTTRREGTGGRSSRLRRAGKEERIQGLRAHDARTFPPQGTAASAARAFVRATLERWRMADVIDDAVLLTSELVTNAVVHAGTDAEVTVDRFGDTLEVSVLDRYAERALPTVVRTVDADSEGGRGLFLIREVARHWGVEYRPDGKRVWFRLGSTPDGEAAGPVEVPAGPGERPLRIVVARIDPDGRVARWRGDGEDLYGWSAADVVGRPLAELIGPDDAVDLLSTCRRDGRWRGRLDVHHQDRYPVPTFAACMTADSGGGIVGVWVEEQMRALLDAPSAPAAGEVQRAGEAGLPGLVDEQLAVKLPYDEFLLRVLEIARDAVGGDAAYVAVLDEDGDELDVRASIGISGEVEAVVPRSGEGASGRLDTLRLPLLVEDTDSFGALAPVAPGLRSLVSSPVSVHGRVIGALAVAAQRPGAFDVASATVVAGVAGHLALALDSARLAELERRRRGSLAFLAEASELLASTLDPDKTISVLAQLVVPRLADWCVVRVADVDEPYAWHADEDRLDAVRRLARADLALAGDATPRAAGDDDDELAGSVRASVPLRARNRALGVLTLGRGSDRRFRPDEIALLEDLGRRAALALDNARLFADRCDVAQTLQNSLLPPELPVLPGIDAGVAYQAAGEGLEVGGDFYDLLTLPDGGLGFAVGDVCGKGAAAAAVTGIARHTLRLLARMGRPLPEVLTRLNQAILDEGERARFVTLLYGELRPRRGGGAQVLLCCAGHPPPMLVRDGEVRQLGRPQPLLGVLEDASYDVEQFALDPGDTLVCYTDGVTERRSSTGMLGEEGLAELLGRAAPLSAQGIADRIQRAVVDFAVQQPRDDLAVLVLRPA